MRGEKGANWQGGIDRDERHTLELSAWRKAVFARDHYTCQQCGSHSRKINAHHIKYWASYPDLRYTLSNGVTLCESCHRLVHQNDMPSTESRAALAAGRKIRLERLAEFGASPLTQATRTKISKSLKGVPKSAEARAHMTEAWKERPRLPEDQLTPNALAMRRYREKMRAKD